MSRKFDRTAQINFKVREILNDPDTMRFLTYKIVRPRPRFVSRFAWRVLLFILLAPSKKQNANG